MQGADRAPVDGEHVAGFPHAGSTSAVVIGSPVALLVGDESAKVAVRAGVAGGFSGGEQSLGADAALGLLHALRDEVCDLVVVVRRRWPGFAALGRLDRALDGLGGGRADLGRSVIGTDLSISRNDVHTFPNCFH